MNIRLPGHFITRTELLSQSVEGILKERGDGFEVSFGISRTEVVKISSREFGLRSREVLNEVGFIDCADSDKELLEDGDGVVTEI